MSFCGGKSRCASAGSSAFSPEAQPGSASMPRGGVRPQQMSQHVQWFQDLPEGRRESCSLLGLGGAAGEGSRGREILDM